MVVVVLGHRGEHAEELLPCAVGLVLTLALLVKPLEPAQALIGLVRRQAGDHGAIRLEVVAELDDVHVEELDVLHQACAEARLRHPQLVGEGVSDLLELSPAEAQVA
eukprot:scaffold27201_cov62-Phaeocystis_antarctica.AAC.4